MSCALAGISYLWRLSKLNAEKFSQQKSKALSAVSINVIFHPQSFFFLLPKFSASKAGTALRILLVRATASRDGAI